MARAADDMLHRDGRMERKHILMPRALIRRAEAMAGDAQVTFAEIVRRALRSYDPAADQDDNDTTLAQLADALVRSNEATIAYVDKVNSRLDKTHDDLAARKP
ncbi:MAG: hypothetical protein H0V62_02970 [Gammaproteobacteria bacterium]|nr:hypothetical protein [Gammaproteobacteria bacterium]